MYSSHSLGAEAFEDLRMNTVLRETVLILSHRLFFSDMNLGTNSDADLTVLLSLSDVNLTVRPLSQI